LPILAANKLVAEEGAVIVKRHPPLVNGPTLPIPKRLDIRGALYGAAEPRLQKWMDKRADQVERAITLGTINARIAQA
jgi:hypothetical protein